MIEDKQPEPARGAAATRHADSQSGSSMTPERWERVTKLFEEAQELDPGERASFLNRACPDDPALRAEVESLLSGDRRAGSFLVKPILADAGPTDSIEARIGTLSLGQVLSGRFRVMRFLGQGGMGEVYEAKDLDLGERVALKTIRSDISSEPHTMARFKQEIQLARRVTHPNVCRMFDLGRHRPPPETDPSASVVTFLTMELLEGETLTARLRRVGRMTTAEALPLVQQMAEALASAHDVGVVHRDFKPGNVMLVPSKSGGGKERAVVTDFGLAKALPNAIQASSDGPPSLSREGHIIGTLAYMAPEQLHGGEATPATDIYALGLVMYEMVAGKRPFADDALFGGAYQRLTQPPPSPRDHVPDLDPRWESAVLRCLEVDPGRRFQSALEVTAALVTVPRSSSSRNALDRPTLEQPAGSTLPFTDNKNDAAVSARAEINADSRASAWGRSRKAIAAALILAAAVSLFAVALRVPQVTGWAEAFWSRLSAGARPGVNPGATVFLTEIKNDAGDPQLDGVTELLRNALGQSAHFNLMTPSRVCEVLQTMTKPCDTKLDPVTAREVAMRDGVPRVIFGDLTKVSDDYQLYLDIEKPDTEPTHRRQHWSQTFTAASKSDLFESIRDASEWARQTVGEEAASVNNSLYGRRLQDITTDSWDSLSLYGKGEQLKEQMKLDQAILLYRQAIEKDPQFAAAYMRLGDVLLTLHRSREGYQYWQKALEVSANGPRHLTPKEELRIRGEFAMDRWDFEDAVKEFQTYAVQFPNDYLGFFMRAPSLVMLYESPDTAIGALLEAEQRPNAASGAFYIQSHLARYYLIEGDLPKAFDRIARLRQAGQSDYADAIEGEADFLQGNYRHADELFAGLRKYDDVRLRSASYSLQANLRAETGRYAEAIRMLDDGIRSDSLAGSEVQQAEKLLATAYLFYRQGARSDCRSACLRAIRLDSGPQLSLTAGTLLARTGYIAEAEDVLRNLASDRYQPISDVVESRLRGEIMMARARPCDALVQFGKTDKVEPVAHERDYLARAELACTDPSRTSSRTRETAFSAYKAMALRPGRFWYQGEDTLPGFWADMLFRYSDLAMKLGDRDGQAALDRYLKLRFQSDTDLPDFRKAQELKDRPGKHPTQATGERVN